MYISVYKYMAVHSQRIKAQVAGLSELAAGFRDHHTRHPEAATQSGQTWERASRRGERRSTEGLKLADDPDGRRRQVSEEGERLSFTDILYT